MPAYVQLQRVKVQRLDLPGFSGLRGIRYSHESEAQYAIDAPHDACQLVIP